LKSVGSRVFQRRCLRFNELRARIRANERPFYGWAVVAVATLAAFLSGPGQSYVFSIFVDPIIEDTGIGRVELSTLYAMGTAISALMVVVVARLVDRFGARVMLAGIGVALGVACLGMSFAAGPLMLFVGFAALRALGQGSLPVTANMLAARWFVRRRGRAVAVVALGLAASNALLPPVAQALVGALGWRGAYIVLGGAVILLLVPAALFVVRDRPEAVGLQPDGDTEPVEEPQDVADEESGRSSRDRVMLSPDFWLIALPVAAAPFIVTALVFHQVSVLGELGVGPAAAAATFIPFAIAAAGATAVAGSLADRFGPKVPLFVSLALLLVALGMLGVAHGAVLVTLYAATLGAASGTQGVVAGTTWAHYYGRQDLGKVQGPATMVMISGAALAPLPLAMLHQLSGSYALGLVVMGVIPLICAVMVLLFDPNRAMRWVGTGAH
jgi:sugar phosphate permease